VFLGALIERELAKRQTAKFGDAVKQVVAERNRRDRARLRHGHSEGRAAGLGATQNARWWPNQRP
jgi:hypothetical protein